MARRRRSSDVRRGGGRPDRRHRAGAADGVGGEGRRAPAARAGPGRASRSSARPVPVARARASTVGGAGGAAACSAIDGRRARRAPTCARWPPTSAPRSAAAPTCAACGAWRSGRSRSRRRSRSADLAPEALLPPAEALRGRPRLRSTPDAPRWWPHGRVLDAEALGVGGEGPWAVVDGDGRPAGGLRAPQGRHGEAGGGAGEPVTAGVRARPRAHT